MVKNEEEIITDTITTEDKKSKRKISKETYEVISIINSFIIHYYFDSVTIA